MRLKVQELIRRFDDNLRPKASNCSIVLWKLLRPKAYFSANKLNIIIIIIKAKIPTGQYKGEEVMFPMIPTEYPFNFRRHQFPIKLCFSMTINTSQGQSFKVVGLDLETECFAYGKLYVGCSRARKEKKLYILAKDFHIYENLI